MMTPPCQLRPVPCLEPDGLRRPILSYGMATRPLREKAMALPDGHRPSDGIQPILLNARCSDAQVMPCARASIVIRARRWMPG